MTTSVQTSYVTVRELVRNTTEVLARVAAGERIEITRNGEPVAVMTPPDHAEVMMKGLVKAGYFASDWQERQTRLLSRLRDRTSQPATDRRASDALIEMRDEERS